MGQSPQQHVYDDHAAYRALGRERPRTGTRRAVMAAILLFAVAAGLVYYASQLWVQHQSTSNALKSANGELARLERKSSERGSKLAALEQQHDDREAKMLELNKALAAAQTQLDELKAERSAIKDQLAEFQQLTQQFQRMIDSGKLEVTFRRGRMIVQLPAQVLFPSGSAELTDDGRKSLGEVARILRGIPNRSFIVAGHTDNVPVSGGRFDSNWDLSSARAVKVTGELIRGGLRPQQLVAAGYSEYDPVASNLTEADKQKNRRIEIILEPRLAPLPELEKPKAPPQAAEPKAPPQAAEPKAPPQPVEPKAPPQPAQP